MAFGATPCRLWAMFTVIHDDVVSWRPHPAIRVFTRPHHRPLTIRRWSDYDEEVYSALLHGRTSHYKRPGAHIVAGVGRTRIVAALCEHGFLRIGQAPHSVAVPTHENVRRSDPAGEAVSTVTLQGKTVHLSAITGEGAQIAAHLSEAGVGTLVTGDGRSVSATDMGAARYRYSDFGVARLAALQEMLADTGTTVRVGGVSDADLSVSLTEQSPGTAWMEAHYDDVPYVLYHLRADSAALAGVFQRGRREPQRCPACDGAAPRDVSPRRRGRSPVAGVGAGLTAARVVDYLIHPETAHPHISLKPSGHIEVVDFQSAVWCMC